MAPEQSLAPLNPFAASSAGPGYLSWSLAERVKKVVGISRLLGLDDGIPSRRGPMEVGSRGVGASGASLRLARLAPPEGGNLFELFLGREMELSPFFPGSFSHIFRFVVGEETGSSSYSGPGLFTHSTSRRKSKEVEITPYV